MTTDNKGTISVIILNWNGKQDTLECISSVKTLEYPDYKIVVVDNGSTDDSVKAISEQYPDVTFLQTGKNLGYAGGNNVGIRWALDHGSDYILILNNDTIVSPNLLEAFIIAEQSVPKGSILGAKIYYFGQPEVIWFAGGRFLDYERGFEHIGIDKPDSNEFDQPIKMDYATGCVMFCEADVFRNVGLLDEEFFLTYEETDWCYRAKKLGHECFLAPKAHVWHKVSASFGGKASPLITYFTTRNKPLWAKKHLTVSPITLHMKIALEVGKTISYPLVFCLPKNFNLSSIIKFIKITIKYYLDPLFFAKISGYISFYFGMFGNCPPFFIKLLKLSQRVFDFLQK